MSLFGFKKKNKGSCCSCKCEAPKGVSSDTASEKNSRIKVLGMGCASCHEQYEYACQAVKAMGLAQDIEYITDFQRVMSYGAISMPVIVIDEKVVSMGRVLKCAEVIELLKNAGFDGAVI